MITEDYCSFEVAKLLKEKGFNKNTICKYADVGGITERWYDDYRERVLRLNWDEGYLIEPLEPKDQYEIIGDTISAPTHQMAMKWLREWKDIFIEVEYINQKACGCTIIEQKTGGVIAKWDWDRFQYANKNPLVGNTYENAVIAGIEYVLDNLI